MMDPFSPAELAAMKGTQESAMQDACRIWAYLAGAVDEYGQRAPGYATGGTIVPCGFAHSAPNTEADGSQQYGTNKGIESITLRLPASVDVSARDRIEVVKRFGVPYPGQMYEVVGDPRLGPSGKVCTLAAVTS